MMPLRKFVPPASITATGTPLGMQPSPRMYVGIIGMELSAPARPRSMSRRIFSAYSAGSMAVGDMPCLFRNSSAVVLLSFSLLYSAQNRRLPPPVSVVIYALRLSVPCYFAAVPASFKDSTTPPARPASPCISLGMMIFVALPSAAAEKASSAFRRRTASVGGLAYAPPSPSAP